MNSYRWCAAIGVALLALTINLAPLASGHSAGMQIARADSTTADATAAWNSVCSMYEFPPASTDPSVTFQQAWNSVPNHHMTLSNALSGITANVNYLMGSSDLPVGAGDEMSATLTHWSIN